MTDHGSSAPTKRISSALLVLRLVTVAYLNAVLVFGIVLFVIDRPAPETPDMTMFVALGAVAVSMLPAVFVVRRVMLGGLGLVAPDDLRVSERLEGAALDEDVRRAIERYRIATFVSLAISETIAILGFVAVYTQGTGIIAYVPFAVGTLLVDLLLFPQEAGLLTAMSPEGRKGLAALQR